MRWHLNPGEAEYRPDPAAPPSRLHAAEGTRVLFIFPDFLAKSGKSAETQCGIGHLGAFVACGNDTARTVKESSCNPGDWGSMYLGPELCIFAFMYWEAKFQLYYHLSMKLKDAYSLEGKL